jgi:hypothetical protein
MARGPAAEATGRDQNRAQSPTTANASANSPPRHQHNPPPAEDDGPEQDEEEEVRRQVCLFGGKRERDGEEEEDKWRSVPYKVGQVIDVLDTVDRWAEAKVLKIDAESRRMYVSFLFWSHHWDLWVGDISARCAYLHTHTYSPGGVLRAGQRLDVLDEVNKWLEAFVADESPTEVFIHFKGFNQKFDAWLPRGSPRIRQFGFGENKRNRVIIPQKTWAVPGNPRGCAVDRTRKIAIASDSYTQYASALTAHGLRVFPVAGDGNCLFRSVAHQLYDDDGLHDLVRRKCMDYMEANASYFAMFVEGGLENFHLYLAMKRELACWGDDPEIQALCEIYGRRAEIWAFDQHSHGARRLRTYHELTTGSGSGSSSSGSIDSTISLSFYGGGHYDSIVGPRFRACLLGSPPGQAEDEAILRAHNLRAGRSGAGAGAASAGYATARSAGAGAGGLSGYGYGGMSDGEAAEQAELELALASSRKEMELFGEEDIETCLAVSLSSYDAQAKYGPAAGAGAGAGTYASPRSEGKGPLPADVAESKTGGSSYSSSSATGGSKSELEQDDKAMLDFFLRQSADEHGRGGPCKGEGEGGAVAAGAGAGAAQSEEEAIEAQILQEALELSRAGGGSGGAGPAAGPAPRATAEDDMLEQALRLSAAAAQSGRGHGGRNVAAAEIVVGNSNNDLLDEEEMLRLAIMQSVETGASPAGGHSRSGNNNNEEDDDEDMRRAIAASMQER